MRVVALVPMKLNNTRLPGKNTKKFTNGEPLCTYVLQTLKECENIDEIFVYCSNPQIKKYMPAGTQYICRSKLLDTNETKMNEVLMAFADEVKADIYVLTHATAPFISSQSIEKGLTAVLNEGYDSAFSVRKIQDFMWMNGRPMNYCLEDIPRTQDINPVYMETSGFYIYRENVIRDLGRRIGEKPYLVEVSEIESCDIDEEEDFLIADAIFNFRIKE